MVQQTFSFLLLLFAFGGNAELTLNKCSKDIVPLASLELIWPGLPAGGAEERVISESVALKFIVNAEGVTENIEVVNSTSRGYELSAKRTIFKTRFIPPKVKCIKYMAVQYEHTFT